MGTQNKVVDYLSIIDIFVLPSLTEGLPMALLEAMACGKAIIGSRVGEIPKVLQHKQDGILVAPNNLEELVSAIQYLYCNHNLMHEYGNSARCKVEMLFSSKIMAKQYCDLYDSFFNSP